MFHRFRIGDMAATIVSDGPLTLPRAVRIFTGAGGSAVGRRAGTGRTADGQAAGRAELPVAGDRRQTRAVRQRHGLVEAVRSGERPVACQPGGGRRRSRRGGCAGADACAFRPLLGHHGATTARRTSPTPRLYLAQAEWDFWMSNPQGDRRDRTLEGFRKHLLPLRDRIQLVRDGQEFLPGVQAWLTPGHTPGHMAYLFTGGWCLTGDVAFHDPLSYRFPEAESAFDTDRGGGRRNAAAGAGPAGAGPPGGDRLSPPVAGAGPGREQRGRVPVHIRVSAEESSPSACGRGWGEGSYDRPPHPVGRHAPDPPRARNMATGLRRCAGPRTLHANQNGRVECTSAP